MRLIAVPLMLAALAAPAAAMDSNKNFWVVGGGSQCCSVYAQSSPEQKLTLETWMAGYVTAMNRATSDTYNLQVLSVAETKARLQRTCEANPDKLFVHAVHELLESLYDKRARQAPQ